MIVQAVVDIIEIVDVEACVVKLVEPFGSLQVPELVEKGIIFLLLEGLHHSVEVPLAHIALVLHHEVTHLNVNDFLPSLYCSC